MISILCLAGLGAAALACQRHEDPKPRESAPPRQEKASGTFIALRAQAEANVGERVQGALVAAAHWGERRVVLVADEDDSAVIMADAETFAPLARVKLDGRPGQLLVLAQGEVAVTLRDQAAVATFGIVRGADDQPVFERRKQWATAVEPLALARAGKDVYVATGWGHTVERFDAERGVRTTVYEVAREPRAVLTHEDGSVYVSHASAGVLTQIEQNRVRQIKLDESKMFARQGYALASLGRDVVAPDVMVMPDGVADIEAEEMVTGGYGGGMSCGGGGPNMVADIGQLSPEQRRKATQKGVAKGVSINFRNCLHVMTNTFTVRRLVKDPSPKADPMPLSSFGTTCLLPRAVATDSAGEVMYVSCLGLNKVMALSFKRDAKASEKARPAGTAHFEREWLVPSGPVGLARAGEDLIVWSQFAHTLSRIPLQGGVQGGAVQTVALPRELPRSAELDKGRELFFASGDTRISEDGRACASCHPDGRTDGIGWSTPGGKRKPLFLAGRIGDGPFGWRGEHKTLNEHVTHTIRSSLRGSGLPADAEKALEAYLKVMPGPPPETNNLTNAYLRGKQVFAAAETGCSGCHRPETQFKDDENHDVGTGGNFRTPPLMHAGGSGPYVHDARYAKLEDFLQKSDGKMGKVSHLSPDDFNALVTYVRSL